MTSEQLTEIEAHLYRKMAEKGVPEHIREGLAAWILRGRRCGHFLTAVMSNDLREAFNRGDERCLANLRGIVMFLYNDAPAMCWGSPQRVAKWRGLELDEENE